MHDWKKWEIKNKDNIYYRGDWDEKLFEKTLVIVGSRRMTRYGKEMVAKFMPDFVANDLTIISGFMYGIDTEAHLQCVEMGGKTIAVLGSGLNYLTTIDNDGLYTKILESGGLVISEYVPDFKATRWSFPQRNKVVARLATEGILVVEAGLKSGSLITARLGREMGKKIFAIPGQINSASSDGCNWLIKNNQAKMITEVGDIINGVVTQERLFQIELSSEENLVYQFLRCESLTVDEIAKKMDTNVSDISIIISTMAMKNVVSEEMGKVFLL